MAPAPARPPRSPLVDFPQRAQLRTHHRSKTRSEYPTLQELHRHPAQRSALTLNDWEAALKTPCARRRRHPDGRDPRPRDHGRCVRQTGHLCLITLRQPFNRAIDRIINFFPEGAASWLLVDLSLNLGVSSSCCRWSGPVPAVGSYSAHRHRRPHLPGRDPRSKRNHEALPRARHADPSTRALRSVSSPT